MTRVWCIINLYHLLPFQIQSDMDLETLLNVELWQKGWAQPGWEILMPWQGDSKLGQGKIKQGPNGILCKGYLII